jgi:hypothetical protein
MLARKLTWSSESLHEMTEYDFSDVNRGRFGSAKRCKQKNGVPPEEQSVVD